MATDTPSHVAYAAAPERGGRPVEDEQPSPRIQHPPFRERGLPPKLLGPLPPKGENLIASSPSPVPVQPVPTEQHSADGLHVAGDEPQREQRYQPEGGNFVGVMASSPFVFGNAVDSQPLPTQPLSTSISHRT